MIPVFIDASVLFSAALSPTGGSREILRLAFRSKLELTANQSVVDEVERNLARKAPQVLDEFHTLTETLPWRLVEPQPAVISQVLPYTAPKDAPHLATALQAQVFCVVSLDRQHMVDVRQTIQDNLSLRILTPGELLQHLAEIGER